MRLGILTSTLQEQPFEEALNTALQLGAEAVDFTTGGYGTKAHCDPATLLADPQRVSRFTEAIRSRGLEISALSCYANPLHPDRDLALAHRQDLNNTILLAQQLGISRVVCFSGCPGDSPLGRFPNWVVYPWPPELLDLRRWQWEHGVLPFWASQAQFALEHGVARLAIEMHAVNAVYNPETLVHLRQAIGDVIGACLNPGHLFWQGIDPVHAIRALGDAVYYVHASDGRPDPLNAPALGNLDAKPFNYERERSWSFRTLGYGHGETYWRDLILALRLVGYNDVITVEHEDTMLLPEEGLRRSLDFLRGLIVREPLMVPELPAIG